MLVTSEPISTSFTFDMLSIELDVNSPFILNVFLVPLTYVTFVLPSSSPPSLEDPELSFMTTTPSEQYAITKNL